MKATATKSNESKTGNSLFSGSKNTPFFTAQTKLNIGAPNDKYEREADSIADHVVQGSANNQPFFAASTPIVQNKKIAESITPLVQRAEDEEAQTKLIQRAEEEEAQTKTIQLAEEEEAQTKLQRQPVEEEEEMLQPKAERKLATPQKSTEQLIKSSKGNGSILNPSIQTEMEQGFGADFSGVKIHTNSSAVQMNKSLGAQAFTTGNDIYFNQGKYDPSSQNGKRLLAHELTHTVQQNGLVNKSTSEIQRDLARTPPGRIGVPTALTPAETASAVAFNNNRYWTRHIRILQDIIGVTPTGTFTENDISSLVEWQADFRIGTDGKIGKRSLKTIILEMMAEGFSRNRIIWLIVDGHNMPRRGLSALSYDSSVGSNAVTSGPIPGDSTVRIGPSGFSQGYNGLVHTIRHEIEHVQQRRAGMANQDLREFLAESIEIMSAGMLWEGFTGFMSDVRRAFRRWSRLPNVEKKSNWNRFVQVRNRFKNRYNSASATQKTSSNATLLSYNAETKP